MRSYNSLSAYYGVASPFGPGWSFGYESRLSAFATHGLVLHEGDGTPLYFYDKDRSGRYDASLPMTERSLILRGADGGYTRHLKEGGSQGYDAAGRLVALVDAEGHTTTLSRDSSGQLVRVTDPGGRFLGVRLRRLLAGRAR